MSGTPRAYGALASRYDALMDDFDYGAWCAYYMRIAGLTPGMKVVDAACGTGNMALALARAGMEVIGVDASERMLDAARQKLAGAGKRIPLVRQDIRELSLHGRVDAVIAACDGVNYLTRGAERFFTRSRACLKPGGALAFDLSAEGKYRGMDGQVYYDDRPDVFCVWVNGYDAKERVLTTELTLFEQGGDGRFIRTDETHRQRAFAVDEVKGLLARAGFTSIRAYGDRTFDPPRGDENRIHFTAIRGND